MVILLLDMQMQNYCFVRSLISAFYVRFCFGLAAAIRTHLDFFAMIAIGFA